MSRFHMKTMILGVVQTNCYIINNEDTKEAIIVDPADDAGKIEEYLKTNDLVCKAILLTHGHFDHIMAATELSARVKAPIYAHEAEALLLGDAELNASTHIRKKCSLNPDVLLKDQQELELAGFKIRVIHTPGHTAGGACYYFSEHGTLISGDTLFREDIGRYDLPTGNGEQEVASIIDKLLILDDDTKVYPGHGISTTIGHEKKYNMYLKPDSEAFDL